jgi:hypothetical protein
MNTTPRAPACAAWLLAAAILAGCGYVGDPLPPALNIAQPVQDLRAVEYGDRIVIQFTIPPLTTEGLVLKRIGTVELRIGPGVAPWNREQWAEAATVIPLDVQAAGPVERAVPARDFIGKDVLIGVRIVNPKGRASDWSNLASLTVRPPLAAPVDIKADNTENGVKLTWRADAPSFRIYRASAGQQPALIGNSEKPEYVDPAVSYDVRYRYLIQSVHDQTESVISEPVEITPEDRFPPAPPSALTASPGAGAIELIWDRSTAPDFKCYRVYRAPAQGAFGRIAEVDAPAYSDRQVESGKTYRYAVTAVDQKGNESAQSPPAEAVAP